MLPPPRFTLFTVLLWMLGPGTARAAVRLPDDFVNQVVVSGLEQPNSMAMLPDGRVLITEERSARVRMVVNGHLAARDPVLVVPEVNGLGLERGLQGIAVDPGWPGRPFVYLFHNRIGNKLRVVRYEASGDLTAAAGESLTLTTPLLLLDDLPDAGQLHNGGCLRFGPDGHLYVGLGDDEQPCDASDSTSLRGQILRLWVNDLPAGGGGPVGRREITPAFHPLATADTNAQLVWAYGLRNPWRFHIDPENGLLYVADPGESTFEKYEEVHGGEDFGWPYREGALVTTHILCPEPGGPGVNRYAAPIATFPNQPGLSAITAAGVYRAPAGGSEPWPAAYAGSAMFGDYYAGFMRRIVRQGNQWVPAAAVAGQPNATDWATGLVSAVDFLVGPDGSLWWLRQFDELYSAGSGALQRIRYVGPRTGAHPALDRGRRLAAVPTPFASHAELSFALAEGGHVTLGIYDLAGRRVRLLLNGRSAAGERQVVWDGRDETGAAVPAGVYLARLERPGASETVRMMRLR